VNLAANLSETSARSPGRLAIRLDDHTMTYRQFDDASAQVAGMFLDPVTKGECADHIEHLI
jgi:acyl-CoA synthetase (AMP-forming)/AMP-acid ligase II